MVRYAISTIDSSQALYDREDIDADFHDPHILHGYRRPNISVKESVKHAMMVSCNECFNVWSHGLTFVYFVFRFGTLFYDLDLWNPLFWPLVCLQAGILFLFSMSTFAHTFNSMSKSARHKCFYLDYAGISIYSLGTGQVFYYYCRALVAPAPQLETPYLFFSISITASVMSTLFMCSTRQKWCSAKSLLRTLSCVVPFAVNSFPLFQRLYLCNPGDDDCETTWVPIFYRHALFMVLGALANVTKFPECRFPGMFDAFGQSHHFLHIFITLACQTLYDFVLNEMNRRRAVIAAHEIQPTLTNSLVLMAVGTVSNLIIALIFQCEDRTSDSKNDEKKES